MALSGTLTGTCDNTNYTLTCEWSATQNITNNTSTITAKVYLKAPSGWSTDSSYWDCTINGTQVTNDKSAVVGGTKVLLGQRTWTVTHSSSGTCSTTISFSYSNGLTSKGTYTTKTGSGSGSITLNTIPRTSSFTLSKTSIDMGASQTVTISRASSSFTHTVQYTFGGATTTTHDKTTSTSVSFTPPISLATKIPNATSGTCTVKVTTYNGSTAIGSTTKTFTLTVPSSVKPTVTLATTYNNTLNGLSIAGKTTVKVTPTGTGSQGSTISSYTYSGAGLSGTGSSKTTGTLNAGSYTVTVTVNDSRGRTNTASTSFTVYAYSSPTCSVSAYRTNSDGTANSSGTYIRLKLTWNVSNPNNANTNTHTYKIEWKKASDTTWSSNWKSGTLNSYTATNYVFSDTGSGWVTTTSYNIRFTVTDSFGSISTTCTVSTINALLNLEKNGVGIGKIYERGKLDVGGTIYTNSTFNSTNGTRTMTLGAGSGTDVYIKNSVSGGVLRLEDSGTLSYNYTPILMGTITSSGNRWGVYTMIGNDGVMDIGKYLDFHESDGDTSDYALRITSNGGNLLSSGYISPNGNSTVRFGYSSSEACTYIANNAGNWLRLTNDGVLKWRGWNILHSNGTQEISGGMYLGNYTNDTFYCSAYRRHTDSIGDVMAKVGISYTDNNPAVSLEAHKVDSSGNATLMRKYTFSTNYFLTHTNNAVTIGSSTYRFKALYATNGTIQTSDGRYKYILENITSEKCYNLIRDINLYGYSTLNKRIDEYTNITEISNELQETSNEDMNLHMGFIAQDIKDNELAKYILTKDDVLDEDGNSTDDFIYGIDNYAYTTAIHGALQHEIMLREKEISSLKEEIRELKKQVNEK